MPAVMRHPVLNRNKMDEKMKVLITGSASMIGAALYNRLIALGHNVIAVVRPGSRKNERLSGGQNSTIIECEMKDYAQLPDMINTGIDIVFAAAWSGTRGSDRNNKELQKLNYTYNSDLLQAAVQIGCKKFITAGSQAEYGNTHGIEEISEETEPNPDSEYGINKLRFYEYAKDFCKGTECTLLEPRFFSIYGPNDYPGSLVSSMLRKMMNNEPCELTACTQLWDFLYIDDAAEGLLSLVQSDTAQGIYNFGYGKSEPLKNYVEAMHRITGSSSELKYGAIPYPPAGCLNLNPNVEKLKSTGWSPKVSFSKGIERIIRQEG